MVCVFAIVTLLILAGGANLIFTESQTRDCITLQDLEGRSGMNIREL